MDGRRAVAGVVGRLRLAGLHETTWAGRLLILAGRRLLVLAGRRSAVLARWIAVGHRAWTGERSMTRRCDERGRQRRASGRTC